MILEDLGRMAYRDAWERQERAHEEVAAGGPERLLLVEHTPVITYGRRAGCDRHLVAAPERLAELGVEIVQSDRGGDITFHGPGQIVAYPIIRLTDHHLSVGGFVHALESAVISTLGHFGVTGRTDRSAVGVWVEDSDGRAAKVCAIGVRIRQGTTLHGLALNVLTDLSYFNLIVPCGLAARPVTSLKRLMGASAPSLQNVKQKLVLALGATLDRKSAIAV